MARRPILQKQTKRLRDSIMTRDLPRNLDLVEYLVSRRMVKTKREAREAILAKRVKVDSHAIGFVTLGDTDFVQPVVPADYRGRITLT